MNKAADPDATVRLVPVSRDYAYYALAVLLAANFLNYTDRFLISAVGPLVQAHFGLDNQAFGWLSSVFTIGYLVASPLVGLGSDRFNRPRILAVCVLLWSAATAGTALARDYVELAWMRALTGVGEAGCLSIGPALVADYFPRVMRGRMLAIFYAGMPLGCAAGYILGGQVAGRTNDYALPFYLAAAPGLVITVLVAFLREPRGAAVEGTDPGAGAAALLPSWNSYRDLLRNRTFLLIVLALATVTFAVMPLVFFFPKYFKVVKGMSIGDATLLVGVIILFAGSGGNLLSGVLGDRFSRRSARAYPLLATASLAAGVPCFFAVLLAPRPAVYGAALFCGVLAFFMYLPLLNTQIANLTTTRNRATAFAITVTVMHLLGDTLSPWLFGITADRIGIHLEEGGEVPATAEAAGALQTAYLIFTGLLAVSLVFSWLAARSIRVESAVGGDRRHIEDRRHLDEGGSGGV